MILNTFNWKALDPSIYSALIITFCITIKKHETHVNPIYCQVREATSEMPDVWFNLAHIYVEQKQHTNAIQMYKNAMRTFKLTADPENLTYLAR